MRKTNSDIVTGFISDEGNFTENRDYFAYVEFEDIACWVLADGLDSDDNKLSAELVVGSIINDFSENPSMEKKDIKQYIMNAHNMLVHESRIEKLRASFTLLLSDYKSIMWATAGNTRLYNFKRNQIIYRSKDHSVAQMLADVGKINSKNMNQHEERNNISQYLGMEGKLKAFISKKPVQLVDGDSLLLCSSGCWENLKDSEIEDTLKESEDPLDFTDKLEDCVLDKGNRELDNYTMVSIFAKKVFRDNIKKTGFPYKKVIAGTVAVLVLLGGFAVRNNIKKVQAAKIELTKKNEVARLSKLKKEKAKELIEAAKKRKAAAKRKAEEAKKLTEQKLVRKKRQEELKNQKELEIMLAGIKNQEKKGDLLYESGEYEQALEMYREAKITYEGLGKTAEIELLDKKIENVQVVMEGLKLEEKGDSYVNKKAYEKAEKKYTEAKEKFIIIKSYDTASLEEKIYQMESILKAMDFEKEGDIYFENANYLNAKVKFTKAKEKFKWVKNYDTDRINKKVKDSTVLEKGIKVLTIADEEFTKQNYKKALKNYASAEGIFKKAKFKEKAEEAKLKAEKSKRVMEALALEEEGTDSKNAENLKDAKKKYEEALLIYQEEELVQNERDVKDKLGELEILVANKAKIKKAKMLEKEGEYSVKMKDFNSARLYFIESKNIFQSLTLTSEISVIDEKLKDVDKEEEFFKGQEYAKKGDGYFDKKKYEDAISNYQLARELFSKLEKDEESIKMDQKIAKAEKKKKRFIIF